MSFDLSLVCLKDLEASGLIPKDVAARPISEVEIAAVRIQDPFTSGYVIPYFDIDGNPIPYYRVRVFGPNIKRKYRGLPSESNFIYFPLGLKALLLKSPYYICIVEGEKKAACMVKNGIPAVGLGGVDNWRNRYFTIPEDTVLEPMKSTKAIRGRLPAGLVHVNISEGTSSYAIGFDEFVDQCIARRLQVIIIFDTDGLTMKPEVQRAASTLGYELRYKGIKTKNVRQLVLPTKGGKVGVDDYIVINGPSKLRDEIHGVIRRRNAFPRHPNPDVYISTKLQKTRMSRKESQEIALSVLLELDARGRRLFNANTEEYFYFDEVSHTLMQVNLGDKNTQLHDTAFGNFIYKHFNLGSNDAKVIAWLATLYGGEDGIENAITSKVFAFPEGQPNHIAYQLSDSHFIIVTDSLTEPFKYCKNGSHGILFEQHQVEPIDPNELLNAIDMRNHEYEGKEPMLWLEVMKNFNIINPVAMSGKDENNPDEMAYTLRHTQQLIALLYYISPWLYRWRGTQLPIELVVGEAGSGKSSLCGLRQMVINGRTRLSGLAPNIKDFWAGAAAKGGIYAMDNVKFGEKNKDFAQILSDELCRLITDPDPRIEMRKLYADNVMISFPVQTIFVMTSIEQPFYNTDLLQRSAIVEVQTVGKDHDSNWTSRQLKLAGGRVGWLAHHLIMLNRFLNAAASKKWDYNYKANHRLINYEQSLKIMGELFGLDVSWIPDMLTLKTTNKISESDFTLAGLTAFVDDKIHFHALNYFNQQFAASDIIEWAKVNPDFKDNPILVNPWKLGRYIMAHLGSLEMSIGLYKNGTRANKQLYSIRKRNQI